jgi:hypothetical protein
MTGLARRIANVTAMLDLTEEEFDAAVETIRDAVTPDERAKQLDRAIGTSFSAAELFGELRVLCDLAGMPEGMSTAGRESDAWRHTFRALVKTRWSLANG